MSAHACLTLAKPHQHEQNEQQAIIYAKVALMLYAHAPDTIVVESNSLACDRIIRDCKNAIGHTTSLPAGGLHNQEAHRARHRPPDSRQVADAALPAEGGQA